eukprot:TRINITY_DN16669_c0_g1_i1.p1 TRINITY_DN16669_c0_g1~~TRINITY_DN16669_c0_g1_i1.p1  ORF type:complete len:478 (+),score=57.69 TRINITY_DN16669_c0_g1_i1:54-1487(+)
MAAVFDMSADVSRTRSLLDALETKLSGGYNGETTAHEQPRRRPPLPGSERPRRASSRKPEQRLSENTGQVEKLPALRSKTSSFAGSEIEKSRGVANHPPLRARSLSESRRAAETIVVREEDFQKHGGNLEVLRKLQVKPLENAPAADRIYTHGEKFARRCREPGELVDPWRGMDNPDKTRAEDEKDLVVNEIWVGRLSPKKIESEQEFFDGLPEDQKPAKLWRARDWRKSTEEQQAEAKSSELTKWLQRVDCTDDSSRHGSARGSRSRSGRSSASTCVPSSVHSAASTSLPSARGPYSAQRGVSQDTAKLSAGEGGTRIRGSSQAQVKSSAHRGSSQDAAKLSAGEGGTRIRGSSRDRCSMPEGSLERPPRPSLRAPPPAQGVAKQRPESLPPLPRHRATAAGGARVDSSRDALESSAPTAVNDCERSGRKSTSAGYGSARRASSGSGDNREGSNNMCSRPRPSALTFLALGEASNV